MDFKNNNRKAQYAGRFYPGTKTELKEMLNNFMGDSGLKPQNSGGKVLRALIAPHAGYVFSGQVAASGFQLIPENMNYKRVFVLGSSHSYSFNGAAVYPSGDYETPLGKVKVDKKISKQLFDTSEFFTENNDAHLFEHSLEVQLPFLQHKPGTDFLLVPIVLGTQKPEVCKQIAETLKPFFTAENLFVISTDFSHYPDYNDASTVDLLTANAICSNNPDTLLEVIRENKNRNIQNLLTSLCGWTSVLTLLYLTAGSELQYLKVSYRNSGDAKKYADRNRVVGYWSIAVVEKTEKWEITSEEKAELLEKARTAIHSFVKTGNRKAIEPAHTNGILNEKTGVFVSVYIDGKLRGCIGGFPQNKTLNELVQQMAVSSSCDSRFDSVQPEELEKMELEISVLSPLKEIKSKEEIVLGKHGIYIKSDFNTGTFLPQVATKMGWNVDEFLGRCSRDKAGIGWDGWKTAQVFTYEAIVFRGC